MKMKKVVNAIILDETKNKVLVIKRKSEDSIHSNKWAFPGGILEEGEKEEQGLRREIKEEIGLEIKDIIQRVGKYEYPRKNKEKTIGRSYFVSVEDFNIKINPEEVADFKWSTQEDLEDLDCVPGIKEEAMKVLFENK